jgi:hypothetical protein
MKDLLKALIEFVVVAALIYALLWLVASSLPGEGECPPPPEVLLFMKQCDGRTVFIRNKLKCRN